MTVKSLMLFALYLFKTSYLSFVYVSASVDICVTTVLYMTVEYESWAEKLLHITVTRSQIYMTAMTLRITANPSIKQFIRQCYLS